jgi:hypothetical protein
MSMMRITQIRIDGGTQPRLFLNEAIIDEYAEDMTDGVKFPPVTLFYDGDEYWLADGFRRVVAAAQIDLLEIDADIRQGTQQDAVLHSVGANAAHGARRTNDDKRLAVKTLLCDGEWSQ